MSDSPDTTLFPLPLVAFEQYMFADDRPDYPANFFLRLSFAGVFDRPALDEAAKSVLPRHPLLRARVRGSETERLEWVAAEQPGSLITWKAGAGLRISAARSHIDLSRQSGLRIFIGQQDDQTEMLLQVHHACCDAIGAVRFVEDLLATYHNAAVDDSQKISLPPLDSGRLRLRGRFGMNPLRYLLRAHKELVGALGAIQYFAVRPVSLTQGEDAQSEQPDQFAAAEFPASSAHTFTVSETRKLRRVTKLIGCTVNDLLLRDLFLALREWTSRHEPEGKVRWFRIMIPTDLRTPADAVMPAANVVGMVFNDRRLHKFSSQRKLMSILRMQMTACKRWRLGMSMVHVVGLFRKIRGGLQWLLWRNRCLATSVLSNLGDLTGEMVLPCREGRTVAANMTLEKIELLPPLRPMTHASFGAVTYAGRLTVSLTYDAHRFTRQGGCQLLEGFVQRILSSLGDTDSIESPDV